MLRLAEIAHRREALLAELQSLDIEEAEIRKAMDCVATLNPALVAIVQHSVTQQGCAEAQTFFDNASAEVKRDLFSALLLELRSLLTNAYGALFVQKVLDASSEAALSCVIDALAVGSILCDVATTASGARTLQRMMELLNDPTLSGRFLSLLCPKIAHLSQDVNSSHIVQRALTSRFAGDKDHLITAITENLWPIATSKHGCCVIQRAIDWSSDAHRQRIIDAVLAIEMELVQDAYGNYVIQHLLGRGEDVISKRAIQQLLHNVAALSCNKFGSNVIEKCVRLAPDSIRQLLIDELTDPIVLPRLLQDSFANYVIQTAVTASTEEQFQQLYSAIRPSYASLKNTPYGIRIDSKIQRRLKDSARFRHKSKKSEISPVLPDKAVPPQMDHVLHSQLANESASSFPHQFVSSFQSS